MRGTIRLCAVLMIVTWALSGCGGSPDLLKKAPPTINTVKSADRYTKQVALVLSETPPNAMGQGAGALYFETLVRAIAEENSGFRLVKPGDEGFPDGMAGFARGTAGIPNGPALSHIARQAGLQGVVVAAVRDIHFSTIRTGILWFRKTRFLVNFDLTADLYDPYSAAKVVGGVLESKVRISEDEYEDYLRGSITVIEDLDEEIADAAEDLGESIGEALTKLPWKASVVGTDGDRVFLPAGSGVGIREGDELVVFEGRKLLTGKDGEQFIAPGYKVGTVQVTAVADQKSEAQSSTPEKIQNGDIVVSIR